MTNIDFDIVNGEMVSMKTIQDTPKIPEEKKVELPTSPATSPQQ